jgi:hypothetical protein
MDGACGKYCDTCNDIKDAWICHEWVFAIACLLLERQKNIKAWHVCDRIDDNGEDGLDLRGWMNRKL